MNKPENIRIEAMSACQLRCPSCPTTQGVTKPGLGLGYLRLSNFKKVLADNPWVKEVELANYGEIFLNPQLLGIVEYAAQRGVNLTCGGANLNTASEEVLKGLVTHRFKSLTCSIDGASQETYKIYRVRGDFDKVIENVKKINRYKKEQQSRRPILIWQFVVFGHNEHELPKARRMAHELNMSFFPKLSWDEDFSPIRDKELVRKETGYNAASMEEYREVHGTDYLSFGGAVCKQLWNNPQINWNGKLLGCCTNYWGDFGPNVFKDGLVQSLNGEKINYAKAMLLGKEPPREDIPCMDCVIYKSADVLPGQSIFEALGAGPLSLRPKKNEDK